MNMNAEFPSTKSRRILSIAILGSLVGLLLPPIFTYAEGIIYYPGGAAVPFTESGDVIMKSLNDSAPNSTAAGAAPSTRPPAVKTPAIPSAKIPNVRIPPMNIPRVPNIPNNGTGASVIGSAVAGGITAGISAYALQSLLSTVDPTATAQCVGELAGTPCVTGSFFGMYLAYGMCNGLGTCMAKGVTPLGTGLLSAGMGIVSGAINLGMKALTETVSPRSGTIPSTIPNTSTYCPYGYTVQGKCAQYVPPASSSLINKTNTSQLLDSLRAPNVSDSLLIQANNINTSAPAVSAPAQAQAQGPIFTVQSGDKGGIQMTSTSVTIQAGVRDAGLNTETAGFFGSNAQTGAQLQDLIARICLVRPWQSPLIAAGIPPSFFDNACTSKNLQVGISPSVAAAVKTTPAAAPPAAAKTAPQPAGPYVAPQVSIWASPSSVPVGSRTSIFWTAKGVDSCIETSPDGSFNGTSLYGSAATVPISAATSFTISCVAPDGSHITDSVKVELAI